MQQFEKLKAESQESPDFPGVQRRVKAFKDSLASTRDTFDRRCALATTYVKSVPFLSFVSGIIDSKLVFKAIKKKK